MSWKDYNFPDISGTDFQTALEGLMLAVNERHTAAGDNFCQFMLDEFYGGITIQPIWNTYYDSPQPIVFAVRNIEKCLERMTYRSDDGVRFLLPDKTPFTLQAAADHLGEELIEPIPGYVGEESVRKYYYANYEWLMQRYRMINLLYQYERYPQIYGIRGYYSGSGVTKAEALQNYDGRVEEVSASCIRCYDYIGWSESSISLSREFTIPEKIRYDATIPARISQSIIPYGIKYEEIHDGSFRKSVYFDFGTGLKDKDEMEEDGEQILFDFEVKDAEFGEIIDIQSELLDKLRKNIADMNFPSTNSKYKDGFIERTMYTNYDQNVIYDLRPGLKFYDDIGQQ